MPKPRSIDQSFWDDPDIATLTRNERLLLIGMITSCADDEGRLLADAGYLRKRVFGYDDDVSRQDVQEWRDNIDRKCRNVKLYEVAGQWYACFVNWTKHQNMRYVVASRLPACPYLIPQNTEPSGELPFNKEGYGNLPENSENSPSVKVNVALSSVALSGGDADAASAPLPDAPEKEKPKPKPPRKTLTAHPIPVDFGITEAMRQWAKDKRVSDFIDIDKHTARFIDYWAEGEGQGKTKKNWMLTWKVWMEDEAQKAENRGARTNGANNGAHQQNNKPSAIQASSSGPNQSRAGLGQLPLAAIPPSTKAG